MTLSMPEGGRFTSYKYDSVIHTQEEGAQYLKDVFNKIAGMAKKNERLYFSTFSRPSDCHIKPEIQNKPFDRTYSMEEDLSPAEAFSFQVLGDEMFWLSNNVCSSVDKDHEIIVKLKQHNAITSDNMALLDFVVGMNEFGIRLVHAARERNENQVAGKKKSGHINEYTDELLLNGKSIRGSVVDKAFELTLLDIDDTENELSAGRPISKRDIPLTMQSMMEGASFAKRIYEQAFTIATLEGLSPSIPAHNILIDAIAKLGFKK